MKGHKDNNLLRFTSVMFEKSVYIERRAALRDTFTRKYGKGLLLFLGNEDSPINYPKNTYKFRQDSNFLYYFGLDRFGLAGIIDLEGGKDTIYGDDFSMDDIIWLGPQPRLADMAHCVGIETVRTIKEFKSVLHQAIEQGRPIHFLPPYRGEQKLLLSNLLGIMPQALPSYVSPALIEAVIAQRSVKEPCEIQELDKISAVGYQMQIHAMQHAVPGMRERLLAGELEAIAQSYGYMTSFATILSQNGQTLHNEDHSQVLEKGRLLLVDCGAESELHYASDHTRTTPVGGVFSQQQLDIYNIVLRAHDLGIEMSKPGVPYRDVHTAACRVITEGLQALGIMKGNIDDSLEHGAHALFMPHGLGHMMGLDTHDMEGFNEDLVGYDSEIKRSTQFGTGSLRFARRLQKGFVVTVEPGIYFIPALIDKWKNDGINTAFINFDKLEPYRTFGGIRLEDDILITEMGSRLIGAQQIPIKPEDVCNTVMKF